MERNEWALNVIHAKTEFRIVRSGVKVLDKACTDKEKHLRILERYQQDEAGLGLKSVEIYRTIVEARRNGKKIYDDPDGCFFDGAGGIIIPRGNMNDFIREEYLKILRDEGKTERFYEFAVRSADW